MNCKHDDVMVMTCIYGIYCVYIGICCAVSSVLGSMNIFAYLLSLEPPCEFSTAILLIVRVIKQQKTTLGDSCSCAQLVSDTDYSLNPVVLKQGARAWESVKLKSPESPS